MPCFLSSDAPTDATRGKQRIPARVGLCCTRGSRDRELIAVEMVGLLARVGVQ